MRYIQYSALWFNRIEFYIRHNTMKTFGFVIDAKSIEINFFNYDFELTWW